MYLSNIYIYINNVQGLKSLINTLSTPNEIIKQNNQNGRTYCYTHKTPSNPY